MTISKPPKTIQVGAINYKVICSEAAINKASVESKSGSWGRHDPGKQQILLDPGLESDFMAEVLLHELIHVSLYHAGTDEDLSEEQTERVCNSVSSTLLSTLRANPDLVTFLMGDR